MRTARTQKRLKKNPLIVSYDNSQHNRFVLSTTKSAETCSQKGTLCSLFSQNMRACRLARGWSFDTLAAHSGLNGHYLSQVERGKRDCSTSTAARIAEALDVPLRRLLGSEEQLSEPAKLFAQRFEGQDRDICEALFELLRLLSMKAALLKQTPHHGRKQNPRRDRNP